MMNERDRSADRMRNIMLGTALATAALHTGIELTGEHGHGVRFPLTLADEEFVSSRSVTTNVGPGTPTEVTVRTSKTPNSNSVSTSTKSVAEIKISSADYAEHFADDPAVDRIDISSAQSLVGIIDELGGRYSGLVVRVYGTSSAEDDSLANDAGVTTPSQKNVELANARRDAFIEYFQAYIDDVDLANLPEFDIQKLPGDERDLAPAQLEILEGYASQFGYDTVNGMVSAWRDNDNVPPVVDTTLQALLGKETGVVIEITGIRKQSVMIPEQSSKDDVRTEIVCVVPVKQTRYETYENGDLWEATIPYGVPLMLGGFMVAMTTEAIGEEQRRRRYTRQRIADSGPVVPEITPRITSAKPRKQSRFPSNGSGGITPSTPPIQGKYRPQPTARPSKPRPTKQVDTIGDPPYDPEVPEKKRRRIPREVLLIPIVIGGVVLATRSCDTETTKNIPSATTAEACGPGLRVVTEVVKRETIQKNRDTGHSRRITP